ncbi:MAG: cation efflux family transporter [Desulfobulbus sp.]|nr:MAG: cation efflux family transporter [Desulfobulbus sp.]
MSHGADSLKSIFFALGANLAIAVSKLAAAFFTGSGAMMAESIHSFADCGNQLLLLIGIRKAKHPPSPDYPLGFGKAIYFWSFIVALVLFSTGGLYSVYEGIHKLQRPEPVTSLLVAVSVLIFSIAAESVSLWGCMREINKVRGTRSVFRWFKETRQSDLLVVLGEDMAALLGLTFALTAVSLTWITGDPMWDAFGSIGIGILLVIVAFFVGIKVKDLLIGQGVEPQIKEAMELFLEQRPEIDTLYSLLTMQMGADVMVAVKALMCEKESAEKLITDINTCEAAFRKSFPETMWLFFEPDFHD